MTLRLTRTALAEEDLIDIWRTIAEENPQAADQVLDRIDTACLRLAEHPQIGPARPDLRPGLRYLPAGNYLILYRVLATAVEVVRVIHGARHLPDLI